MGQVITGNAAAEDILSDVETTYARATARGGDWQALAAQRLGTVRGVIANVKTRMTDVETELLPLSAAVQAQDIHADRFIGQLSDTVWNAIGRPAFEPTYDVVFPGGIACYTDGTNEDQPDRMDLLADLLEMNLIARLAADLSATLARQLREEAETYRKMVEPYAKARRQLQQLQRARTAVAQCARMELAHLKRLYKAAGFSEAEIHSVIPDRPRAVKKAHSATPTPAPAPAAI